MNYNNCIEKINFSNVIMYYNEKETLLELKKKKKSGNLKRYGYRFDWITGLNVVREILLFLI